MARVCNLIPAMEALLPAATVQLLRRAGVAAAREGAVLYLVGGSVRDLLLGRPVMDLDLVAEGDGPSVAEALAAELGGRVAARSQFGTAKLVVGEQTLDVATARLETYDHPGALPAVRPGTLRDDLGPARLHRQRHGSAPGPGDVRGDRGPAWAAERTCRSASCAPCTTAASSTTPPASCGRSATSIGWASAWTGPRRRWCDAMRPTWRPSAATASATRWSASARKRAQRPLWPEQETSAC